MVVGLVLGGGGLCASGVAARRPGARREGRAGGRCAAAGGPEPPAASGREESLEDIVARLAAAEAEAAKLKEQLESSGTDAAPEQRPKARVDSVGGRETLFGKPEQSGVWLSEGVEFLTGDGPSEATATPGLTEEEQATVNRRIALGALFTVGFGALALKPDDSGPPPKPLFYYLVPLVRVEDLLQEALPQAEDADWPSLERTLKAVLGPPNNVKENMLSAASALDDANDERAAKEIAFSVLEYLEQMDYKKYFDAVSVPTGTQNLEFSKFCSRATRAAQKKMGAFLAAMPAEDIEAARSQVAALKSADYF